MKNEFYPLSKTEEGIFVSCLKETDAYNLANLVNLGADLDVNKFADSVKKVFEAHPYLFTVLFQGDDGNIYKKIRTKKIDIPVIEVNKLEIESKPYKMLDEHLFRLALYKCNGEYFFYYDFHHIIFDGTSIKLFIDEVLSVYEGNAINDEKYDANKFALDEAKLLSSKKYSDAKSYFEKIVADTEVDSWMNNFRTSVHRVDTSDCCMPC